LLALLLAAAAAGPPPPVSDARILAYAHAAFDARAMMGRREVLGRRGEATVVADHPCSDICPQYTRRIVHLLTPGACDAGGGVMRDRLVPMGVATQVKPFCVPRVLAGEPR
jgi:hypothetical protein